MIDIDIRLFYKIGIVCFSIIALMNLVGLVLTFNMLVWNDLISRIASTIFNFALVGFFIWLYRQLPPPISEEERAKADDILEMLK